MFCRVISYNNIISMYEKEFLEGEYSNTLWVADKGTLKPL